MKPIPEHRGLVLKIRAGFKVYLGPDIQITVEKATDYELKLRIEAPDQIQITWDHPNARHPKKIP